MEDYSGIMKPITQYTKSGRINIAYQVFGSGPVDIVYIPGWVSNIDLMWDCSELVQFFEELGKVARVILFDKRGTGLSDRVVDLSTLEERMDDIRAVMDAVDSEKAVLFGHSEGGSVSALFAATYPNRTSALIAFGIFAKRRYSPNYPWAPTDEERQKVYDMIESSWGGGDMELESLAPSKADDPVFMEWLANYFRSGASPSAALVLTKMNTQVDIIDILGSIKVPTLILQRTNDIDVKIEEGRFIADRIEGAKFVEFSGDDHLFWAGNTQEILDEMKDFLSTMKPIESYKEQLLTIIRGNIGSSGLTDSNFKGLIGQYIGQFRGKIVEITEDFFIAAFEGPSKAVHSGIGLLEAASKLELNLSIAVYIKESAIESIAASGDTIGTYFDTMLESVEANKIIITETVKNLLSGAGLSFSKYLPDKETIPGISSLYTINDEAAGESDQSSVLLEGLPLKGSLLERVLQSIDKHLADESYSVEMLSRDVGLSERQLQRKLKQTTNKTPNQLISSVRLHRAKELIITGKSNISEACYQTGFSSPSYFSKCFKQEFGKTPTAFQEAHI
ncbi:MAG: alpha/beta fold hydrolase [Balneolaceae bacterium]|nr:alpha/beta fold hydrolase [Balneolaceae bacterium]MBO6546796.1 alpha/beta fold hydrolase [Balneolaceae bacterium]MBO6649156.1 alpha/beta fold hydrolase [Balneolaceae bacterium]